MMQGSVIANERYAEFLAAAAEDRLDYSGKVLDQKKAKKFHGEKMKKYSLGAGGLLWNEAFKDKKTDSSGVSNNGTPKKDSVEQVQESASFEGLPDDSMLTGFISCHEKMAEKFNENFTFIKEVALAKTTALRKELEAEANIMSMLGDATIYELEKAEDDVQKAWGKYNFKLASMHDLIFLKTV